MLQQALESVVAHVNRYRTSGDRDAVLGHGVLADAGPLRRGRLLLRGSASEKDWYGLWR
jgi:hypothetical protein